MTYSGGTDTKWVDGKPRVSSTPYTYDISEGNVPDHEVLHKFGYNAAVPASEEDIWEGSAVYVYLTSATTLKISSSDVDDTSAGAGARTVKLFGVDGNYVEITETVTLSGQTSVNTANQYLRIYRMIIITAGATGSNEGTVYAGTGTVTSGVPATVYNQVGVGANQSLMGLWTVAAGRTAFITDIFGSTGIANKTTQLFFYIRPFGEVFQLKQTYHIIAGVVDRVFTLPFKVVEKSDIAFRALASGGGGAVSVAFTLWHEKN